MDKNRLNTQMMKNFFNLFIIISFQLFLFTKICIISAYAYQSPAYKVGLSDVLEISVWGEPDLNKIVTVSSDDGTINFPLLGKVFVFDLTVKEIEQTLTDLLGKDYLVNPQVYVNIKEYNSQKVLVLGEVENPGPYTLTGETTILEIISKAGGVTEKSGPDIMIYRNDAEITPNLDISDINEETLNKKAPMIININELLKNANITNNINITSGDVIVIKAKKDIDINEQQVYISGEVNKPGAYEYQNGLSAFNLCILAGGFTNVAAPNRATLIRNINGENKVYKINLNKIKKGNAEDFKLSPGDRINIPESFW